MKVQSTELNLNSIQGMKMNESKLKYQGSNI